MHINGLDAKFGLEGLRGLKIVHVCARVFSPGQGKTVSA